MFSKFFGGFKSKPAAPDAANFDDFNREPRRQHYAFAHVWLRTVAFSHPNSLNLMRALRDANENGLLRELWKDAGEEVPEAERLAPTGLSVDVARYETSPEVAYLLGMVTMPTPQDVTEAHLVAIAFGPVVDDDVANAKLRYFTLELGATLTGEARTAFCEWSSEGAHLNYGDGPPPDSQAFANAVLQKLSGDGSPPIASLEPGIS